MTEYPQAGDNTKLKSVVDRIETLNAEIKEKLARTGTEPATSTPEGLEKFRLAEIEKWRPVIVASGFKAD